VALTPEPEPIRLQKKPGLAARISAESHVNTPTVPNPSPLAGNNRLPSGLTMPWNLDDEQLAAEMQAYTLQEIGRSMAESEATHPTIISTETVDTHLRRKQSKFKPKAPALRYQERHPEEVIQKSEVEIDELSDHDMDGDVEYVIDTYIRMPAEALDGEANVGELVINDKDVEGFYTEDLDHEEEVDDEEDENGLSPMTLRARVANRIQLRITTLPTTLKMRSTQTTSMAEMSINTKIAILPITRSLMRTRIGNSCRLMLKDDSNQFTVMTTLRDTLGRRSPLG